MKRFLSIVILSASFMIGLISQLHVSDASSLDGDAFENQFPNIDKLTRQEIAELRRSFAQKTINELKKQKEATGEMDPSLFVMDIKADMEPAHETEKNIGKEDERLLADSGSDEEEHLFRCANGEDIDSDERMDLDEENTEHEPSASGPKSDDQIDSMKSSATDGKKMKPIQHKSSNLDTSNNQDEELIQKESTSTDHHGKSRPSEKLATPNSNRKEKATTKSPKKPNKHAKDTANGDTKAEKQSPAADGKDEDKKATDVNIPSPVTDKKPTQHDSTASNEKANGKHKKSSTTDKKDKSNQKKSLATYEHVKADPENPSKEEL